MDPSELLPAFLMRFIASNIAREVVTNAAIAATTDLIVSSFDDTSKEICLCLLVLNDTLNQIEKSLIDGFVGRDIESEKLQRSLGAVGSDIGKAIVLSDKAKADMKRANSRAGEFSGVDEFFRLNRAEVRLRELEQEKAALEQRLAKREQELEKERGQAGPQTVGPGAPGDVALPPAVLSPEAVAALEGLDVDFAELAEAFRSGLAEPLGEIAKCCKELPLLLSPEAIAVAPAPPPLLPARDEFKTLGESLLGGAGARNGANSGDVAAVAELEAVFDRIKEKAGKTGSVLIDMFENLSRGAGDFTGVLGGVADALGGIGGKAGDAFGILAKLFGAGGGLEGLLGSLGGGLFGFAGGGTVQPGFPAIVGERGPELFIPAAPGRIVNNAGAQGMVAGRPIHITQNMTFTTDVRNSVRAEILNTAPAIVEASKRAVAEAVTRGRGGGTLFR